MEHSNKRERERERERERYIDVWNIQMIKNENMTRFWKKYYSDVPNTSAIR